VSEATARAQAFALALQTSAEKVFAGTVAKSGPVTASDIQTLVSVGFPGSAEQATSPAGSATFTGSGAAVAPSGKPLSANP
jgi:hypothetical protein